MTSKFVLIGPTSVHRSIFLPILILKRICSLSSYTGLPFRSSRLIQYGTFGRGRFLFPTRAMVPAVSSHSFKPHSHSPHLHVLRPGSLTRNKVRHIAVGYSSCCVTSHIMCQRVVKVKATSFISVFILGIAVTLTCLSSFWLSLPG